MWQTNEQIPKVLRVHVKSDIVIFFCEFGLISLEKNSIVNMVVLNSVKNPQIFFPTNFETLEIHK